MDPFSLLLLAQTAVGAITAGCEMLREGKAIIDDFKGEAEGVVDQINDAKDQVLGLWAEISGLVDWAQGLWASLTGVQKPKQPPQPDLPLTAAPQAPQPVAKKANRKPQRELTYEEYQARAVHDICENLKVYFEAIRELKIHCR